MNNNESNNIIEKIKALVDQNKSTLKHSYVLLKEVNLKDLDSIFQCLIKLFEAEGEEIAKEHTRSYVTDDYEDGVRRFAMLLMKLLWPYHDSLKDNPNYEKLCGNRHIAYGLYKVLNTRDIKEEFDDKKFYKIFYLGLVDFYDNFYGSFYDNEEAIELLCKFYPKHIELQPYEDKIVSALYSHVSNAGTPNDRGYAWILVLLASIACFLVGVVMIIVGFMKKSKEKSAAVPQAAAPVVQAPVVQPTEVAAPVEQAPVAQPTEVAAPVEQAPVAQPTETVPVAEVSETAVSEETATTENTENSAE